MTNKKEKINFTPFPIEKLLLALRAKDGLTFIDLEDDLNVFPEFIEHYDHVLQFVGQTFENPKDKHRRVKKLLDSLEEKGLVTKYSASEMRYRGPIETLFFLHSYNFTVDGLELVLKLEAHNDAERRHNDTVRHNKLMRQIGIASFSIAFLSILVGGFLTNENIELSKERLKLSQARIESLEKQVSTQYVASKEELKQLVLEVIDEQKQAAQNESTKETPPLQNLKAEEQTKTSN